MFSPTKTATPQIPTPEVTTAISPTEPKKAQKEKQENKKAFKINLNDIIRSLSYAQLIKCMGKKNLNLLTDISSRKMDYLKDYLISYKSKNADLVYQNFCKLNYV